MRYAALISVIFILTGCGIGGQWMNGNPSAGRNIKPYLHYWVKQEATMEQRREDSANCGGSRSDTHPVGKNDSEERKLQLTSETIWETRERINTTWKNCMKDKGYSYVP